MNQLLNFACLLQPCASSANSRLQEDPAKRGGYFGGSSWRRYPRLTPLELTPLSGVVPFLTPLSGGISGGIKAGGLTQSPVLFRFRKSTWMYLEFSGGLKI